MADYGHDLIIGVSLMPNAAEIPQLLRDAQAADRAGLDLIALQDHPYNPGFLDTPTLIGQLAAVTERIRFAGDVLNLPLRPPAVLAKATATLDLMTGGRIELGLGAGGYWDAIEAFGGRRLTPGQGVDALSEAIDVIRAVWGTAGAEASVDGRYYKLLGVQGGPAPAHPVSIWVGGYKPRMLRLIAAKADGWWPSIGMLPVNEIAASSRRLDDAAVSAGRDPREIRRVANLVGRLQPAASAGLLQGPAEQWVDQLTLLILEHGFSAFAIVGSGPGFIDLLGQEIAPAVREAVARERAAAPVGQSRPAIRLTAPGRGGALRRPSPADPSAALASGIDYAAIPAELTGKTITPRDPGYDDVRSVYMAEGRPGLVILAETVADVQAAVRFAATQPVPLSVRSGGHGVDGTSTNDGGILIDLSALNRVAILDRATRRFRAGVGATWEEVAAALAPHGWAMTSGNAGSVGVGGLGTNGGIGWLVRKHGYTVDHVVAADVILADGTLVRTDTEHDPDLLWAVRGAAARVGVVTALELEAIELSDVIYASLRFDARDTELFLVEWARASTAAPRELTNFTTLVRRGPAAVAQAAAVWAGGDAETAVPALEEFMGLAPLADQQAQIMPYSALMAAQEVPHHGSGQMAMRNGFLPEITTAVAHHLAEVLRDPATVQLELRPVDGAPGDLPASATAFSHRTARFFVSIWGHAGATESLDRAWAHIAEHVTGSYAAYSSDTRPERLAETFPGRTGQRLREIAARYDPDGLFAPARDRQATVGDR